MEVSVRPITVSEELAAVGRTRARRCRAALSALAGQRNTEYDLLDYLARPEHVIRARCCRRRAAPGPKGRCVDR